MWQMDCICLDAVNCIQKRWAFSGADGTGGRECGSRKEKRELLVGSRDIPLFYARVLEGMEALGSCRARRSIGRNTAQRR